MQKNRVIKISLFSLLYYIFLTVIVLVLRSIIYGDSLLTLNTMFQGILRDVSFVIIIGILWYVANSSMKYEFGDKHKFFKRMARRFVIVAVLYFIVSIPVAMFYASYMDIPETVGNIFNLELSAFRSVMFLCAGVDFLLMPYQKNKKE